jgi:hypothetical protein
MTVQKPPVAASSASTPSAALPGFDERWDAWLAKGAAHDRATRRKMTIAAPVVLIVLAIIVYALLGY